MNFLTNFLPSVSHLGLWGYWLVFFIAFLESLVLVGVVVPGSVLIIMAGFFASRGYLEIGDLIWFVAVGAILGDGLSYYLGVKGTRFFHNENKWLKATHLDRGQKFFQQHGSKSIFLARFIPSIRSIMPFVAGLSGMDKIKFFFWDITSAFIWAALHILLGYFFGSAFIVILAWSTRVGYAIGIIALAIILFYIIKFIVMKHGRRLARLARSILSSLWHGLVSNHDVQKLMKRHPHFFAFLKRRTDRQSFFGLPLTLLVMGLVYTLFFSLGIIEDVLHSDLITAADLRIANLLVYFRDPQLTKVFLWITLFGKWQMVLAVAMTASLILWLWRKKDYIAYLWLALLSDGLFGYLGKIMVRRPRPLTPAYLEHSFSFPSGHAMIAVVLYGFIAYVLMSQSKSFKRQVNIFFGFLAIAMAVGVSRLYLGVHYLSDVLGGYLLGLLVLTTVTALYEWRHFKKQNFKNASGVISTRTKVGTAILVMLSFGFYAELALTYQPPLAAPAPQVSAQFIIGDISTYFDEHKIPKYSEILDSNPQEPLGFIFLAQDDNTLTQSFKKASWYAADGANFGSVAKIALTALSNGQYLTAPMTPSFWNAAVNDFGFEKATPQNTVRQRHHIRIWKTNFKQGDLSVYVGTASLDEGIKWLVTHRINPDIDTERLFVKDSLQSAGVVQDWQEIQFVNPVLGKNFSKDPFFTSGKTFVILLKN